MVPENIHTPTTEGHWKFHGGVRSQRPKFSKESMSLNWNFQRGGGLKAKNPLWGEYGYFLEQHIDSLALNSSNGDGHRQNVI